MDYSHIYPEVSQPRDDKSATDFPAVCPSCQAAKTGDTGHHRRPVVDSAGRVTDRDALVQHYERRAAYACGGTYTYKPQIQTHTSKWWGSCGVVKSQDDTRG